jgi:p-hydroxybenzoate 3-monooxygenase
MRSHAGIEAYSARRFGRIWCAERFSWRFTTLMRRLSDDGPITAKFQQNELDYSLHSEPGARSIAENNRGSAT